MLHPNTMTPEQEKLARAQAFYLLKKFTSFTFLDKARSLYQGFLNAYANLLNQPVYRSYTPEYKRMLSYMIPIENGLHLLRTTPHKLEAYRHLQDCTVPISAYLFGRDAHEIGRSYEPFFQALGMVEEDSGLPDTGVVKDVVDMSSMIGQWNTTVFYRRAINISTWKSSIAYNYLTMFDEAYYKALPSYKRPYYPYIYPFNFPTSLPPCPGHNTDNSEQIWSGETIQVHGIYEPWLMSNKVGCPNYFLAGQEAIEYQLEGSEEKQKVRWRLIWQDKRYLDGTIPPEESWYLQEPAPVRSAPTLSAQPGQPCPKEGLWFAPHLKMKEVRMNLGEPMPGELYGPSGEVIWYYKGE